jgi:hypothetical protein
LFETSPLSGRAGQSRRFRFAKTPGLVSRGFHGFAANPPLVSAPLEWARRAASAAALFLNPPFAGRRAGWSFANGETPPLVSTLME